MKTVQILFVLVCYTVITSMIIASAEPGAEVELPELDVPDYDVTFRSSCSGLIDCTKFIGDQLLSMAKALIFLTTLIFNLIVYVFGMFLLLVTLAVTGVDGAPTQANLFIQVPMTAGIGIILFRMIRKGDDSA